MNTLHITGEDLKSIDYTQGKAIGTAMAVITANYTSKDRKIF